MKYVQVVVTFTIIFLLSLGLSARPEYAAKHRITRCTACHVSPVGGGPKNINGKQYGARGFGLSSFAQQDNFSLDYRALYYRPDQGQVNKGGMGSMAAIPAASFPISSDGDSETRLLTSMDLGVFSPTGIREGYLLWKLREGTSFKPQYVLVGRLHAPFGLMNDEHRTYVRMQTNTTWNHFEMGVLLAGNPSESLHYDLFFVNGNKSAGGPPSAGRAETFGTIFNLRWSPRWPVVLGISASSHDKKTISTVNNELKETALVPQTAQSLYAILPINRMTGEKVQMYLNVEYSLAQNWNTDSQFLSYLTTGTNLSTLVAEKSSQGLYVQLGYELSSKWTLIYKFDELLLDRDFPTDYFRRHGFGVDHWLSANTALKMRVETAEAKPEGQDEGTDRGRATLGSFFMLLQASI
ncbi:MAG: hypothetical protein KDD50_07730 [Bdellovibrionales bacterium]|nr:hypothetical protein [Bdellovibrionales bacterium]